MSGLSIVMMNKLTKIELGTIWKTKADRFGYALNKTTCTKQVFDDKVDEYVTSTGMKDELIQIIIDLEDLVTLPSTNQNTTTTMQNPSSIQNPVVQVLNQQAWPRTIKLQSQTTFNGKESENIENWLSLLVLNFELVKLHSDDWIGVAATYLRENALKL